MNKSNTKSFKYTVVKWFPEISKGAPHPTNMPTESTATILRLMIWCRIHTTEIKYSTRNKMYKKINKWLLQEQHPQLTGENKHNQTPFFLRCTDNRSIILSLNSVRLRLLGTPIFISLLTYYHARSLGWTHL